MTKTVLLCILDGVGIGKNYRHNAVALADMPFFRKLFTEYPHSRLKASGTAVGLPRGIPGNSEVGHATLGAGRIMKQFLQRFEKENLNKNSALKKFTDRVKFGGGVVHIAALMSDGRVHSDISEIIKVAKRILKSNLRICIHFISDGRDTLDCTAATYIDLIRKNLAHGFKTGQVFFGTLCGRYYAMDRNNNMKRTRLAFNAIANAKSDYRASTIDTALHKAYRRGETDEFILPTVIHGDVPIRENDGFIFGNYRSDRSRQLVRMILNITENVLCFSNYGEDLNGNCSVLLPSVPVKNTLGDILERHGKSQLRIAETEKYNHVTYFFDAERNIDYKKEKKILIPSARVATFDLKPEMSASKITNALLKELPNFDVVILNYANGDMVGHTGNEKATIRAMEFLDKQLSKLVPEVLHLNGAVLITADHGNAEQMWDAKHQKPWTAHTTNPVPLILVSNKKFRLKNGGLADVAPTMLDLLGIAKPQEMTGKSLIK